MLQLKLFSLLFAIALIALVQSDHEHVYLWKITHPRFPERKPSYLLGTMHVPWKILYNKFPDSIKNAIEQTDVVVSEANADISDADLEQICVGISSRGSGPLADGQLKSRIKTAFPNEPIENLPLNLLHIRIYWLNIERQLNDLKTNDPTKFDAEIMKIGTNKKKPIRYLEESLECMKYPSLTEEMMLSRIEKELDKAEDEKKNGTNALKTMVDEYKRGAALHCGEERQGRLQKETSQAMELDMIHNRNKKWIEKMDQWMCGKKLAPIALAFKKNANTKRTEGQSFFFAVGFAHITSEKGSLIELLQGRGYTVSEEPQNGLNHVGTSSAWHD